jgi:hypothetical protein
MKFSLASTDLVRLLCAALMTLSSVTRADIVILETASMGLPAADLGGIAINSSQFLGARFHINQPAAITRVGGHFTTGQNGTGGDIFAAIAQLAGPSAFPTGLPFTPGEVLANTLIAMPTGLSAEVLVPLSVTLQPGDYLLVFGSGLFGATGEGSLTTVNPVLTASIFPYYNANNPVPFWADRPFTSINEPKLTMRIVVQAVPEPRTIPKSQSIILERAK